MAPCSTTVVSSPGKVLVAGGYLVLDPAYSGVVVSTSSRFYTIIAPGETKNEIVVRSPQFVEATWRYSVQLSESGVQVADTGGGSKNKFVFLALQKTLALALEIKGLSTIEQSLAHGLQIIIAGDNDFYSQRAKLESMNLPRSVASLSQIPPFTPTGVKLADVHKTGLGSSAALITSLVTGLLLQCAAIPRSALDDVHSAGRRLAHNAAQFVHCLAQGKVGSGFDVAAAVFGSQLYTRFDPAVLAPLMDEHASEQKLLPVLSPENGAWNYRVQPFQLPPMTRLMLADVDAGSDTPSLVGKVLKWRTDRAQEANATWTQLDQVNQSLASTLLRLSQLYNENKTAYTDAVNYLASLQPLQWQANPHMLPELWRVTEVFHEVHTLAESVRAKMREMGELSGVPIEPKEQTELLDTCVAQAGVICGGVPGAGGYDAIWLLVIDPSQLPDGDVAPMHRVERVWGTWKGLDVSPLSAKESVGKGIRIEALEQIPGLREAATA